MEEIVTLELLSADIIPALFIVLILESVVVAGNAKVAPELLVNVFGLKTKVPFVAKVTAPELVNVPPVSVIVEVDWKLMVLLALLVIPVLVMVVRTGKLRVV